MYTLFELLEDESLKEVTLPTKEGKEKTISLKGKKKLEGFKAGLETAALIFCLLPFDMVYGKPPGEPLH